MARGGARKGAGRPKGSRKSSPAPAAAVQAPPADPPKPKLYATAEDYLEAVVTGAEPADRDRIAAAKAMLPYQKAKQRMPLKSEAPTQMALSDDLENEKVAAEEWQRAQDAVRRKLRLVGAE